MAENNRVTILLSTRDRLTEVCLLLQSLRSQNFQEWDLILCDGSQPQPVWHHHTMQALLNRIKLEGHRIHCCQPPFQGVLASRQKCVEELDAQGFEGDLCLRVDDDVILNSEYLRKLLEGINAGYDVVSGLTPVCGGPHVIRETKFIKPIINRIIMNEEGDVIHIGDDQGFVYDTEEIIPTHHFRSSALYKRDLHHKGWDYKFGLSNVGFREELHASIKTILAGGKIAVHLGAKYHHLVTPSGGCRFPDYGMLVNLDEHRTREWLKRKYKEVGNFLAEYDKRVMT